MKFCCNLHYIFGLFLQRISCNVQTVITTFTKYSNCQQSTLPTVYQQFPDNRELLYNNDLFKHFTQGPRHNVMNSSSLFLSTVYQAYETYTESNDGVNSETWTTELFVTLWDISRELIKGKILYRETFLINVKWQPGRASTLPTMIWTGQTIPSDEILPTCEKWHGV